MSQHERTMSDLNTPFLMRFEARPEARVRLLCFPHAGGSASAFAAWHRALPREIEVFAVQLPGRENRRRDRPFTDMQELICELTTQFAALHDRPVALFGHSLGAVCAFEYARGMRRAGRGSPVRLFASAAVAPQQPRSIPSSHLPQAELVRVMVQRYDGIPKLILDDPELLDYFMSVLRLDLKLLESFRYVEEPPLDCPLHAMGGTEDLRVSQTELNLWSTQTKGPFATRMYPGGHFFVSSARDAVLASIGLALRETQALST